MGAAAGAAGTTMLNAVTYGDIAIRGRSPSKTPEQSVHRLTDAIGVRVPGETDQRENRIVGLAALLGIAAGVATGAVVGLARAAGWRRRWLPTAIAITSVAMLAGNAPMTGLGVTDPRTWSRADWLSDVVPHVGFGAVTAAVLVRLDP